MRSTTKRLEHLEKRHRTRFEAQSIDARALVTEKVGPLGSKDEGQWVLAARASADHGRMKERLKALFAGREARR